MSRCGVQAVVAVSSAALAGCCATALTWWLVGDLSYFPPSEEVEQALPLDRMLVPPVSERTAGGLAALAVLLLPLSLVAFALACWRLPARRYAAVLLACLLVLGALLGSSGRALTAGGIGANIGGGIVLMFGAPVVLVLALIALTAAVNVLLPPEPAPA